MSSPVSTGMGDHFQGRGDASLVCNQPPRPAEPPALSRMGNEYRPKCVGALWLGCKGRYGSFHLWINVWVAGTTV